MTDGVGGDLPGEVTDRTRIAEPAASGDLRPRAIRGAAWSLVQQLAKKAATLVVFALLANLLTPEDFGVVALAVAFTSILTVLQEQGFGQALVQREDLEPEHLNTAFWWSLGVGLVLVAITVPSAAGLAGLLDEPSVEPVLQLLSLGFVLAAFTTTPTALLRRQLRFKTLALRDSVATVAGGALGVLVAVLGGGVYALVTQQLATALVAVVVLWAASGWRPTGFFSRRHFREIWSFGVSVVGVNVLAVLRQRGDDLLIGAVLGITALGYFSVALRLLTLLTDLIVAAISNVSTATFARLQGDRVRLGRAFMAATRLSALLAVPAFLGVGALTSDVIPLLFGSGWDPAVPVMQIVAVIGAVRACTYYVSNVLISTGKPSWALGLAVTNTICNLLATAAALGLGFGLVGVVLASGVRTLLIVPLQLWLLRLVTSLRARTVLRGLAGCLLAGAALGLVTNVLVLALGDWPALARVLLVTFSGALVYLLVLHLADRRLLPQTLAQLKSLRRPAARTPE